ncbi:autotransporter outer membrane beta-barrel domain-containing protein [Rhizobium sp. C4]|uniref:autotransporter outer membrane beta-barrel domain-containing protein n=1 Tax=Rhizobium sp. C4 TaxID=1349800 RepID=UPI001E535719|nr:autotransporter domain-containing protein [Rhizobium sp. C4]MCD2172302.1 autotransporter domain-containing protein [Rhizobium sp. C4]
MKNSLKNHLLTSACASVLALSCSASSAFADAAVLDANATVISQSDAVISQSKDNIPAVSASNLGRANLTNATITTTGMRSVGASAASGGIIKLSGGSISSNNTTGQFIQNGDGTRSYALLAADATSFIDASDVTIVTLGQRAYGAYATSGSQIDIKNSTVRTEGFMAYGVYASGPNSTLNATNVDITTIGHVGDAVWAYNGGTVNFDGGKISVSGDPNPAAPYDPSGIMTTVGNGTINAKRISAVTLGVNSVALRAGGSVGPVNSAGTITLEDSDIRVEGAGSSLGAVVFGSLLTANGSTLTATNGAGFYLQDNATLRLTDTSVSTTQETFKAKFTSDEQQQDIVIGDGSTVNQNNGTLLLVQRSQDAADGVVNLSLGTGAVAVGDIVDVDDRIGGGHTDVEIGQNASYTGRMNGIRNLTGLAGSTINSQGLASISGSVEGTGATFAFSETGASIGGDVRLASGSVTTGGSQANHINVAGNVEIDATSTLGGNWTIGGNLLNAGTIAPGNSIGTISVAGNYNQGYAVNFNPPSIPGISSFSLIEGPGATYVAELLPGSSTSDLINVTGTATIDNGSILNVSRYGNGPYALDAHYTVLTAAGGVTGTYILTGDTKVSAFYTLEAAYDDNNVYVNSVQTSTFADKALTTNQLAVAGGLDALGASNALRTAVLSVQTDGEARSAYDQLSGEVYSSAKTALIDDSRFVRQATANQVRSAVGAKTPSVWAQGYGSWGSFKGDGNASGFDRNAGGFFIGADGEVLDTFRLGVVGGYGHSAIQAGAGRGSVSVDTYSLGVYGGGEWNKLTVNLGLNEAWHQLSSSRSFSFSGFTDSLSADYHARTTQAYGDVGYRMDLGSVSFEPFAGLAYVNLNTDGFTEKGGFAALTSRGNSVDATFTTIGLRAESRFDLEGVSVTASGMAAWRHSLNQVTPTSINAIAGGAAFSAAGAPLARDVAVFEAGLSAAISQNATIGVSYSGQFGNGVRDQGIKGRLSLKF